MTNRTGEDSPIDSTEEVGVSLEKIESVSPDVYPVDHRGGRDGAVHKFTTSSRGVNDLNGEDLMPVADEERDQPVPKAPTRMVDYYDDDGAVHFGGCERREVRLPAGVPVPSSEMVRQHRRAGHCPYRPWCEHCVSGAANAPSHGPRDPVSSDAIPELHCDYAFFRDKPKDTENTVAVLVGKDRATNGISADVVPNKGAGAGYAVKQLERNIRKFGNHGQVVLRSDGENAIQDLFKKVCEMRSSQTVLETTPKGTAGQMDVSRERYNK